MRQSFALALLLAALGSTVAFAQTAAVAPKISVLLDDGVSGQPNLHSVTANIDWPAGASTGRHIHGGDEYAVVLEGAITVTSDGEAPRTYTAGQAYHNARGVVHEARNAAATPAKTVAVLIVDKGAPLTQPVK